MTETLLFTAGLVIIALIIFVVFAALRSLTLWYFCIDEHIANQKKMIALLEKLTGSPDTTALPAPQVQSSPLQPQSPPPMAPAVLQPRPTNPLTRQRP